MALRTFTLFATIITIHLQESLHSAKLQLGIRSPITLSFPSSGPQPYSRYLGALGTTLYKWDHTVFVILWQAYFTQRDVLKFHSCCNILEFPFLFFKGWKIFYYVYRSHSLCPFISWWTHGLLPPFGCCEWRFHECGCEDNSLRICF